MAQLDAEGAAKILGELQRIRSSARHVAERPSAEPKAASNRTVSSNQAWEALGGGLSSAPAVASWANGRLDVFVRGTDNASGRSTTTVDGTSGARSAAASAQRRRPPLGGTGASMSSCAARTTLS